MWSRCTNPTQESFYLYGGRGIKVCERWGKFENFFEDMGAAYKYGLTLDRVDVDGDYTPENCCWVTHEIQANNTRRSRKLTIGGITKSLSQWCKETTVKSSTVRQRFYCLGWPIEDALWK